MGLTIGSSEKRIGIARTTPSAMELHIEELVLHGFPAGDRLGIGDAVQQELSRLVAERGMPGVVANPLSVDRLDAGSFKVGAGAKPQAIGAQLAQKLHQQLAPLSGRHRRAKGSLR